MGAKMPEEEMQPLVDAWRAANPHIVQFWYALGNAASEVIEKRNTPDDVLDYYPVDRLMHDIALALMAVQTQTTGILDEFPTKAAQAEATEPATTPA